MKKRCFPIFILLLASALASAQDNTVALPQGSSIPGLSAIPLNLNGPAYIEAGGGHSAVTNGNPDWNDAYLRLVLSGGSNTFNGEASRQSRYGDTGWFLGAGVTHVFSENWYADVHAGTSTRCFFLPKYRFDGFINRKLLARKQLIATVGAGYDQSKDIHHAYRMHVGGAYYFSAPVVLQGGVSFTRSSPGDVLARTQYVAVTQGHEKEHFVALRAEYGREAYQLIGPATALVDFPVRDISLTWRQWLGLNWGVNFIADYYHTPSFSRAGGTVGIFLDF